MRVARHSTKAAKPTPAWQRREARRSPLHQGPFHLNRPGSVRGRRPREGENPPRIKALVSVVPPVSAIPALFIGSKRPSPRQQSYQRLANEAADLCGPRSRSKPLPRRARAAALTACRAPRAACVRASSERTSRRNGSAERRSGLPGVRRELRVVADARRQPAAYAPRRERQQSHGQHRGSRRLGHGRHAGGQACRSASSACPM